jgi:hypothetical protein
LQRAEALPEDVAAYAAELADKKEPDGLTSSEDDSRRIQGDGAKSGPPDEMLLRTESIFDGEDD